MNNLLAMMSRQPAQAAPAARESAVTPVPFVKGRRINRATSTAVLREACSTELGMTVLRNSYMMAKAARTCMEDTPECAEMYREILRRKALESMRILEDWENDCT